MEGENIPVEAGVLKKDVVDGLQRKLGRADALRRADFKASARFGHGNGEPFRAAGVKIFPVLQTEQRGQPGAVRPDGIRGPAGFAKAVCRQGEHLLSPVL